VSACPRAWRISASGSAVLGIHRSATDQAPQPETPDLHGAFPRLDQEQLEALAARGERRPTQAGDVLYRGGDEGYDFFVVLEGAVAVVEGYGEAESVVGVHGPGRVLGELACSPARPRCSRRWSASPGRSWSCRWTAWASWSPRTRRSATWCSGRTCCGGPS
jgi:CRP-like cAMP-binding protein